MTETIIKTAPRNTAYALPAERWQFRRDERGNYFVKHWVDENKLTKEELESYTQFERGLPDFLDTEQEAYIKERCPHFPTLALAEEWAALEDEEMRIADDIQTSYAPNTPGDSTTTAFMEITERREALRLRSVP